MNRMVGFSRSSPVGRVLNAARVPASVLVLLASVVLGGCQSQEVKLRDQGLMLYNQNHYNAALDKFNAALKADPSEPRANYYAGAAAYKLHKYDLAAMYYRVAATRDPNYGHVQTDLARALIKAGKPNEAMNLLESRANYTQNPADRLRIARFYVRLGDLDDARTSYEKAVQLAPTNVPLLLEAAHFFDRIGQKDHAAQLYKQVYRIAPETPGLVQDMQRDGADISDALPPQQ